MFKQLKKLSKTLSDLGFDDESSHISKIASKASARRAKAHNWNLAEKKLLELNIEPSREAVQKFLEEERDIVWQPEAIQEIYDIKIEDDFAKILNKNEKIFIEIGGYESSKKGGNGLGQFNEIKDYLIEEEGVKKPGDLFRLIDVDLNSIISITSNFEELNNAQLAWHEEARRRDKENIGKTSYKTNEVVHDFGDGWVVVYVPAAGEGPAWKGDSKKSHDRTHEGNLLGLCLGENMGLFQSNKDGRIYSVRDPENKPHVTIRKTETNLYEAKGKNNQTPNIDAAIHADQWFKTLGGLDYKSNGDYRSFPPLTIEEAEPIFAKTDGNQTYPYQKGWASHWYKKGSKLIDEDIEKRLEDNNKWIVFSGFGKKYKELAQPVVEYWTKQFITENDNTIFAQGVRDFGPHNHRLTHESWKTYKKERWMQEAVKKLSETYPSWMFKLGINRIYEYKAITAPAAKKIADTSPDRFFWLKIHETHPEFGEVAAKSLAEKDPNKFFQDKLHETYPEVGEPAAKNLARLSPIIKAVKFFEYKLHETYPEIGEPVAMLLTKTDNGRRVFFRTHRLHETYPEIGETAAKMLAESKLENKKEYEEHRAEFFFANDLEKTYPEHGKIAAKNISFKFIFNLLRGASHLQGPKNLFKLYPEAARDHAIELAKRSLYETSRGGFASPLTLFFKEELDELYPEITKNLFSNGMRRGYDFVYSYFYKEIYLRHPEFIEQAAKIWIDHDDDYDAPTYGILSFYDQHHKPPETGADKLRDIASALYEKTIKDDKRAVKFLDVEYSDKYSKGEWRESGITGAPLGHRWSSRDESRGKQEKEDIKLLEEQLLGNKDGIRIQEVVGFFDALKRNYQIVLDDRTEKSIDRMIESGALSATEREAVRAGATLPRDGLFFDDRIGKRSDIAKKSFKSFYISPEKFKDQSSSLLEAIAEKDPMFFLKIARPIGEIEEQDGDQGQGWMAFIQEHHMDLYRTAEKKMDLVQKILYSSDLFKNYVVDHAGASSKANWGEDALFNFVNYNYKDPVIKQLQKSVSSQHDEIDENRMKKIMSKVTDSKKDVYKALAPLLSVSWPSEFFKFRLDKVFPKHSDDAFENVFAKVMRDVETSGWNLSASNLNRLNSFIKYLKELRGYFDRGDKGLVPTEAEGADPTGWFSSAGKENLNKFIDKFPHYIIMMTLDFQTLFDEDTDDEEANSYAVRAWEALADNYPSDLIEVLNRDGVIPIVTFSNDADAIREMAEELLGESKLLLLIENATKLSKSLSLESPYAPELLPEDEDISPEEIPIGLNIEEVGEHRAKDTPQITDHPSFEDLWFQDTGMEKADQEEADQKLISEQEELEWDEDIGSYDQYKPRPQGAFSESRVAGLISWLEKNGCRKEASMVEMLISKVEI